MNRFASLGPCLFSYCLLIFLRMGLCWGIYVVKGREMICFPRFLCNRFLHIKTCVLRKMLDTALYKPLLILLQLGRSSFKTAKTFWQTVAPVFPGAYPVHRNIENVYFSLYFPALKTKLSSLDAEKSLLVKISGSPSSFRNVKRRLCRQHSYFPGQGYGLSRSLGTHCLEAPPDFCDARPVTVVLTVGQGWDSGCRKKQRKGILDGLKAKTPKTPFPLSFLFPLPIDLALLTLITEFIKD